jgi:hypothetical protein
MTGRIKLSLLLDCDDVEYGAVARALLQLQAQQRTRELPYGSVQAYLRCWVSRGYLVSTLLSQLNEQAVNHRPTTDMVLRPPAAPIPERLPFDEGEPLVAIAGLDELFS